MSALKVYIETTIFNRYFENGREYSDATRTLFEMIQVGKIEGYSSLERL